MIETILAQLVNGLVIGAVYSLIAVGLTLIWSIADIPDFAQGGIYTFAAFAAYFTVTLLHFPYFFSLVVAVITGTLLSVTIEKVCYRPLRGSPFSQLLVAIALFFLLANLAIFLWTPKAKILPSPLEGIILNFAGFSVSLQRITVIAAAFALFIAVNFLLKRTKLGKAIRATAQDPETATLMGINRDFIYTVIFALGGCLTAIAAALIAPLYAVYPEMGTLPLLKALVVVVFGGMGSFIGALAGGFLLGLIETFGAIYVSVAYQHGFAFIILILTLIFKPGGLFGRS